MKDGKKIIERIKSVDINKIKEMADAVSKFIDIVVGVVMSVMLAIVGIQQNLSMEKQEEQFAALQNELNEKAQTPAFRLAEDYDADGFTGYTLINDGRIVTCLDIKLEKWLHIQTRGEVISSFIVPYNMISAYIPTPETEQDLNFVVERASAAQPEQTEAEEGEMPEQEDLPVRLDLMDVQPFVSALQMKLQEDETIGYNIRSMEILTLSFIDKEQTHETRRYFVGMPQTADAGEGKKEHPMYVMDDTTWQELLSQIPEGFERTPDTLNQSIYADLALSGFDWRHDDELWQEALIEQIVGYIGGMKQSQP